MNAVEARAFEQHPLFSLRMRRWDEEAKDRDTPTHELDPYKQMCQRYWVSINPQL
jgi:predicted HD phosphohydrolase